MIPLTHMNIEDRVRRYTERGLQKVEAEILVLIEESAAAIFTSCLTTSSCLEER